VLDFICILYCVLKSFLLVLRNLSEQLIRAIPNSVNFDGRIKDLVCFEINRIYGFFLIWSQTDKLCGLF
jgi:hypothetical protein